MKDIEKTIKNYIVRERSDYQLKHFVIGQHDTPEMQYRQIILEVKSLLVKIKMAELEVKRCEIKLKRLSDDELDQIDAEEYRISISVTNDAIEAAKEELGFLLNLAKNYQHYSPDDIENNQREYWEKRLEKQANFEIMSIDNKISVDSLINMTNVGLLKKEIDYR